MSAAWHGGILGGDQYVNNASLRSAISLAMNWWFNNDFTNVACLDAGDSSGCPCDTPGLWNPNWFSNVSCLVFFQAYFSSRLSVFLQVILIPEYVGQSCLLLNGSLSATQIVGCSRMTLRSYGTFGHDWGYLTGANTVDVAKIGLDQGLRAQNATLIVEAFDKIRQEVLIKQITSADGIRPDGSFGQHGGMIYNGNYGKD